MDFRGVGGVRAVQGSVRIGLGRWLSGLGKGMRGPQGAGEPLRGLRGASPVHVGHRWCGADLGG